MDTVDFNKLDIDIFMTPGENIRVTKGNSSQLEGDLNFAFDHWKSKVNLHNASPGLLFQSKQDYYSKNIFECGNDTKNIQIYKQVKGEKSGCRFAD